MGVLFPILWVYLVNAALYSFDDLSHSILRFSTPRYANSSLFSPAVGPDPYDVAQVLRKISRTGTNARNVNDFSAAFLGLIIIDLVDLELSDTDSFSGNVSKCNVDKDVCCTGASTWTQARFTTFSAQGGTVLNKGNGLLDLTFLYGATNQTAWSLRGERGKLRTDSSQAHLPSDNITRRFVAGDSRINEHPILAAVTTLLMREHNRLATDNVQKFPSFSDEQIYQLSRKWMIAFWQKMVYYEYLGADIGGALGGNTTFYNDTVSTNVTETFIVAAKAFPTFLSDIILRLDAFGNEVEGRHVLLQEGVNAAYSVMNEDADSILRGMLMQAPPKAISLPHFLPAIPSSFFFRGDGSVFASMILEGRDIGLRRLRDFVTSLSNSSFTTINTPSSWFSLVGSGNVNVSATLQNMYGNITNADPIVVLLAAALAAGSNINTLLSSSIRLQLQRTRDGDPLYFEHIGVFTRDELKVIYSTHLTEVLKRNAAIFNVPVQAFFRKPAAEVVDGVAITEEITTFSSTHDSYSFSETPHPHFKMSWSLISGGDGSPHIKFFLEAKTLGWVGWGVGLQGEHAMLDTDMVYVTIIGPNVSITDRHALGISVPTLDTRLNGTNDIYATGAMEVNGFTQVWFSRALAVTDVHDRPILDTEMAYTYAFNAFGSDNGYHGPTRGISKTQFVRKPVENSRVLQTVLQVFASIVMTCFVLLGIFILVHHRAVVVKAASPPYCLYMLVGACLVCGAVFPLTVKDSRCSSSLWLVCMGLSMMFAAIFVKNLRLAAIFLTVSLRKQWSSASLTGLVVMLSAIPFTILVVMEGVDQPALRYVPHPTILYALKGECTQRYGTVWIGLLVSFFAIVMAFGLHIASSLWSVKYEAFNEAGGIILALNQFAVLGVIFIPALLLLDFSEDILLAVEAIILLFGTSFAIAALFAWKVWIVVKGLHGSELAVSKDASVLQADLTTKAPTYRTTGGSVAFLPRSSMMARRPEYSGDHKDKSHHRHSGHSHDRPELTPSPGPYGSGGHSPPGSQLGDESLQHEHHHPFVELSNRSPSVPKRTYTDEDPTCTSFGENFLIITTDADSEMPPKSQHNPEQCYDSYSTADNINTFTASSEDVSALSTSSRGDDENVESASSSPHESSSFSAS